MKEKFKSRKFILSLIGVCLLGLLLSLFSCISLINGSLGFFNNTVVWPFAVGSIVSVAGWYCSVNAKQAQSTLNQDGFSRKLILTIITLIFLLVNIAVYVIAGLFLDNGLVLFENGVIMAAFFSGILAILGWYASANVKDKENPTVKVENFLKGIGG